MNMIELEKWMKDHNVNDLFFRLGDDWRTLYDGHALCREENRYLFFYVERGRRSAIEPFALETEGCARALQHLEANKWATSHMIGFFKDETDAMQLKQKLDEQKISYFSDSIPYGGATDLRHRIFVFGADIEKVKDWEGVSPANLS